MCIGCHTSRPKRELVRVVREPDGTITLDDTGRKNGRGAYLCPNSSCMQLVWKGHKLEKAFETQISESVYQALMDQMEQRAANNGGGAIG